MTDFILLFSFYAFAGWVMETIYRTIKQRRVVNPGFLVGPFLPIYGFFTTLVICFSGSLSKLAWEWQFLGFVFLSTLLEYVAGWFFERFFHLQLWDYHTTPFNLKGRIALPFSLLWGILGLVFHLIIHPAVQIQMLRIPQTFRSLLAILLTAYIIWDIIHSTLLLRRLEYFVTMFQERYERSELMLFHSASSPFRRFLHTYPKMRHTISEKMALLYAKQEALEHFLSLQRKKFSNLGKENGPHSLD
ncbi:membrane protein [Desulfosporosinus sp. I2]|uniref:putative ABC transporter permease n=1 Tax=Desulfosporosinus sp. I2 TaxID=1617025 RepID=UPI0005EF25FC|nr:putative ABC transporter permease [Desulfosporosinus sp. I2]KJR48837.1 membrane protein [Desulfosporosinus sp. I2]